MTIRRYRAVARHENARAGRAKYASVSAPVAAVAPPGPDRARHRLSVSVCGTALPPQSHSAARRAECGPRRVAAAALAADALWRIMGAEKLAAPSGDRATFCLGAPGDTDSFCSGVLVI